VWTTVAATVHYYGVACSSVVQIVVFCTERCEQIVVFGTDRCEQIVVFGTDRCEQIVVFGTDRCTVRLVHLHVRLRDALNVLCFRKQTDFTFYN
jgi:hypothetical protein